MDSGNLGVAVMSGLASLGGDDSLESNSAVIKPLSG